MRAPDPPRRRGGGWRRPALVPTLITVPMLAVLIALGTWQLDRLAWKTAVIEQMSARTTAAPTALPAQIVDPEAWAYRRVVATGTFRHDRALFVLRPSRDGQAGYHVITPLLRPGGAPALLINRGFVPFDRREAASRPAGPVTVEGIARVPLPPGWFAPANVPADGLWYRVDLGAMAAAAGLDRVAPVYVDAVRGPDPAVLPVGGQTRLALRNDHFGYALTWYGLALGLVVVYLLYHRRR